MERGQGGLEYLLVLAGVLLIAVFVVLTLYSLTSTPATSKEVQQDILNCKLEGITLKNYEVPGDFTNLRVIVGSDDQYCVQLLSLEDAKNGMIKDEDLLASCTVNGMELRISKDSKNCKVFNKDHVKKFAKTEKEQ